MLKILICFLLFIFVSGSVEAATGCVNANRTIIYSSYNTKKNHWLLNSASPVPNGCFYYTSGTTCNIEGGVANEGLLGDTSNLECPIDDYIWVMVVLIGGVGFYIIRQKNIRLAIA